MADDAKSDNPLEPDPRFPSGPWVGFYLQPSVNAGRFRMELSLTFRDGTVTGDGEDAVGPFVLRGRYDLESGDVTLHKRYRTHQIHYKGCADGSNRGIWGVWTLGVHDRGGFHIWPLGQGSDTGEHAEESVDEPVAVSTDG